MDKQKKIEEMANTINLCSKSSCADCVKTKRTCIDYFISEKLYNAGYRKITEGEVVITREQYEKLKGERTLNPTPIITEKGQADWLDGYKVGFKDGVQALQLQSKEKIDEICKEITEDKENAKNE